MVLPQSVKIHLYPCCYLIRFTLTEFGFKPFCRQLSPFRCIATTKPVTQWNNICGNCAWVVLPFIRQRYPMIDTCRELPEHVIKLPPTGRATSMKVIEGVLPLVSCQGVGKGALPGTTISFLNSVWRSLTYPNLWALQILSLLPLYFFNVVFVNLRIKFLERHQNSLYSGIIRLLNFV